MPKTRIYYMFPPVEVHNLPTWRFILHFKAPFLFRARKVAKVIERLKTVEWKIMRIAAALDSLKVDPKYGTLDIPIEITEDRRNQPNALADYESDIWRIYGNVVEFGFGDLFYEAVDWKDPD